MSKRHQNIPQIIARTKSQRARISLGARIMLAEAEAKYRQQQPRKLTLADLVDEYRSADLLGPIGQQLFDRAVDLHLDDWLELPFQDIDRIKVMGRWANLHLRNRLDEARWFLICLRELRGFCKVHHPEVALPDNDPVLDVVSGLRDGSDQEQ